MASKSIQILVNEFPALTWSVLKQKRYRAVIPSASEGPHHEMMITLKEFV